MLNIVSDLIIKNNVNIVLNIEILYLIAILIAKPMVHFFYRIKRTYTFVDYIYTSSSIDID